MATRTECKGCGNKDAGTTLWRCSNGHIFCDDCGKPCFIPCAGICPKCGEPGTRIGEIEEVESDDDNEDDDEEKDDEEDE